MVETTPILSTSCSGPSEPSLVCCLLVWTMALSPLMQVMSMLPMVEQLPVLEQIAAELGRVMPEEHRVSKNFIFKSIMNYLNSEEIETLEDQGTANILACLDILKEHLKPGSEHGEGEDVNAVKEEPEGTPFAEKNSDFSSLKLHKLKEFKINGSIGNPGQKDKLAYGSLSYQIQNGKERGFLEKEICSAVIRAITPGSTLRTYLECCESLKLKSLIQVLRSHFKEVTTSVFTEMSNAVQLGSENELEFCMRLMGMHQKVLILSKEEDCPYEAKLVQSRFQHALFTGLKHNNMRHELRSVLKGAKIKDEDLLQEISDVMVNETEHSEKLHTKLSKANVNTVDSSEKHSESKIKKDKTNLLTEISKLSAQVGELSGLKEEIENLKSEVKGYKMSKSASPFYPRTFLQSKIMVSGVNLQTLKDSGEYPCSVYRKGVGSNSIYCAGCSHWVHQKCSGVIGSLKSNPDYRCSRCNPILVQCSYN